MSVERVGTFLIGLSAGGQAVSSGSILTTSVLSGHITRTLQTIVASAWTTVTSNIFTIGFPVPYTSSGGAILIFAGGHYDANFTGAPETLIQVRLIRLTGTSTTIVRLSSMRCGTNREVSLLQSMVDLPPSGVHTYNQEIAVDGIGAGAKFYERGLTFIEVLR